MSVFRRYILTSKTNDKSDKIINKTQAFTAQNHVSNNAEPREKMKHQEGVHPYTASHRAIPILGPNETSRIIRWKPCQRAEKWPKPEWDEQKANRSEHNHSLRIRRTMVMKVHPIMSHKAPNRKKKKHAVGAIFPRWFIPLWSHDFQCFIGIPWNPKIYQLQDGLSAARPPPYSFLPVTWGRRSCWPTRRARRAFQPRLCGWAPGRQPPMGFWLKSKAT